MATGVISGNVGNLCKILPKRSSSIHFFSFRFVTYDSQISRPTCMGKTLSAVSKADDNLKIGINADGSVRMTVCEMDGRRLIKHKRQSTRCNKICFLFQHNGTIVTPGTSNVGFKNFEKYGTKISRNISLVCQRFFTTFKK